MRIRVTGAGGFLGRPLLQALRSCGHEASALEGDVALPETFAAAGPADALVHLAAQSSIPQASRDPVGTWRSNVDGTLQAMEWARRDKVGRVVLASSAHVYGYPLRTPIDEGHPLQPRSLYGATKMAAEALALAYHASSGVDAVIVRPFNIYGPGQAPGFLVPDILGPLRQGHAPVLGDPRPVRDYTFVDDAVALLAAVAQSRQGAGEAVNLGSGQGHSVRALAETAARVSGTGLAPAFDAAKARANDTGAIVADAGKARQLFGWQPRVGLEEGLRRTWQSVAPSQGRGDKLLPLT